LDNMFIYDKPTQINIKALIDSADKTLLYPK
jgi:hypothetical protein